MTSLTTLPWNLVTKNLQVNEDVVRELFQRHYKELLLHARRHIGHEELAGEIPTNALEARDLVDEVVRRAMIKAVDTNPDSTAPEDDVAKALPDELESLKADLASQKDRSLRLAADFDSFRKRTAQETDRRAAEQKEAFIRELLPVIDNLERALASDESTSPQQLREGVQITLQQLNQLLRHHGIESEDSLGQPFDPHRHDALRVGHDASRPDHTILEFALRGADIEGDILVTLDEVMHGSTRTISLQRVNPRTGQTETDTIRVHIPPGVREGQAVRVRGKGGQGAGGGAAGDLYLRVRLAAHPDFRPRDADLYYDLDLAPWEAVLGTTVTVPTLGGRVKVRIPPGTNNGQQLRVRGQGLPKGKSGERGDLYVVANVQVPQQVSEEERALWEKLSRASRFNPRQPT